MSEVLTNDEIAALVEAARGGQLQPKPADAHARRPRRVREVDFTRPTKFTQDQQRRLSRGHDAFCRAASTQLSAELRTPYEFEVINVDQQTWSAAVGEIPQPSLYAIIETNLGGRLLVSVEHPAVMRLIERMLGGASTTKPAERELTEIEIALARRMFGAILVQLSRVWEELMSMSLALVVLETQQSNIQLVPSSEPTLAITIEARSDGMSSTITLLVPHRSIEPGLEHLNGSNYGDTADIRADAETAGAVQTALRGVNVEVRAEVAALELTIDEVLALKPGDVVKLGPAAAGGTLYADAVPIHRTKPGRSGKRRAVEILHRIEDQ